MELTPALSAAEVVDLLGLRPHPEGGYFRETFRAAREVKTSRGPRSLATGILFLLTQGSRSRFHRLQSEELWLHQAGAAVELVMLPRATGPLEVVTLAGPDVVLGCGQRPAGPCRPQSVVPAGVWQAARVASGPGGPQWGLAACIVVPGFDYADLELAERRELSDEFPQHADLIEQLT